MTYSQLNLEHVQMREASSREELDANLGRLALSEIPGFCVRESSVADIIGSNDWNFAEVVDVIHNELQRKTGWLLNIVLRDYELAAGNQSKRGIHADNPASANRLNFRIHRTVEGSCDVQFAREQLDAPSVSPERDDKPINELLQKGIAASDYFEPILHTASNVRLGDFVVFTSVGPRPTWHDFITVEAPRLSLVTFIES